MVRGEILYSKYPIGDALPDPFFDSYKEEVLTCHDILELVDNTLTQEITVTINKDFLRKLSKSHIAFIKEMEKTLTCPQR